MKEVKGEERGRQNEARSAVIEKRFLTSDCRFFYSDLRQPNENVSERPKPVCSDTGRAESVPRRKAIKKGPSLEWPNGPRNC